MYDRVKVTSSTTGTGALTLDSGASVGFRAFYAVSPSAPIVVPYLITGGSSWELGYGTYDGNDPGTLTRDTVIASSNSNALVSLAAGTKEVSIAPHTTTAMAPGARHNWNASTTPTVSDDNTLGYAPGSMWRDARRWWVCTSADAGDAVWEALDSPWINRAASARAELRLSDVDADPWPRAEFSYSMFLPPGVMAYGRRFGRLYGPSRQTTGAASTPMEVGTATDGAGVFRGTLLAVIVSGGNKNKARAWSVEIVWRNTSGTAALIGSPTPTAIAGDSELSAATAVISVDSEYLVLTVTGVADEDVAWSLIGHTNEAYEAGGSF
jgi:hypothetical protein